MKSLGLALIAIAVLSACGGKKEAGSNANDMKIVFYIKDSVATHFDYFKDSQAEIEKMEQEVGAKANALQQEYAKYGNEYQTKMSQGLLSKNGEAFYTKKIQELQLEMTSLEQTEGAELNKKAEAFQKALLEKLDKYSEEYAADHKINLFLAKEKMGSIIYADSALDVTMDFIKYMNDQEKK